MFQSVLNKSHADILTTRSLARGDAQERGSLREATAPEQTQPFMGELVCWPTEVVILRGVTRRPNSAGRRQQARQCRLPRQLRQGRFQHARLAESSLRNDSVTLDVRLRYLVRRRCSGSQTSRLDTRDRVRLDSNHVRQHHCLDSQATWRCRKRRAFPSRALAV